MLAEIICALIGRDAGLPIPRPILIKDSRKMLGTRSNTFLFGMEDAEHPSVRMWIEARQDPAYSDNDISRMHAATLELEDFADRHEMHLEAMRGAEDAATRLLAKEAA
jgi:hypothetical protein